MMIFVSASITGYEQSPMEEKEVQWPGMDVTIELKRKGVTPPPEVTTLVTVPDLFKKRPQIARKDLNAMGLKIEVKYTTNQFYQPGIIIRQEPEVGKKIKKGSTVTVYVNRKG